MPKTFPFTTRDGRDGIIRVARARDARACLDITREAMDERPRSLAVTQDEFWSPRDWRAHRMEWSPAGVTLVAEVEGEVVGVLSVHRGARTAVRHTAEFGITVARAHRSNGVGRALIATAETWGRAHDVDRMTLRVFATNERAQGLYRTLGYTDEGVEHRGVRFADGDIDVYRMFKFLDASLAAATRDYDERPRADREG